MQGNGATDSNRSSTAVFGGYSLKELTCVQEMEDEEDFLVDDSDEGQIKKKKNKQKAKKRRTEEEDEEDEPVEVGPPQFSAELYHSIAEVTCLSMNLYIF